VAEDLQGILMKALAGGFPQVGCQVKVVMSGHGANVPQVCGQVREFGLDFNSFPVPPMQGRHGEAMTQIVKSRGPAPPIEYPGRQTQILPVTGQRHGTVDIGRSRTPVAPDERTIGTCWQTMALSQFNIFAQFPNDGIVQRDQARLVELGLLNAQDIFRGIEVSQSQAQQFAATQAAAE
jgi:hypothetical protein